MQLNFNSYMKSNFNTDGRTDGRDEDELAAVSHLTAVDTGARTGDPAMVGELLDPQVWLRSDERHPVARRGDRQPIPGHVRAAVYLRDRGRCELCGWERVNGEWHLDHITPWSAGGTDTSDNLRVLCAHHNLQRSNHRDPLERPRRPVTWWCVNCHADGSSAITYLPSGVYCAAHKVMSGRGSLVPFCGVVVSYDREEAATGEVPDWHRARPVEHATRIAFCAHCRMPAGTDVTL